MILFDSDLAAKVGTVYTRLDETIGFSKTNNLRRIDTTDSSKLVPAEESGYLYETRCDIRRDFLADEFDNFFGQGV